MPNGTAFSYVIFAEQRNVTMAEQEMSAEERQRNGGEPGMSLSRELSCDLSAVCKFCLNFMVFCFLQLTETNHDLQRQFTGLQQSLDAAKQQRDVDIRVSYGSVFESNHSISVFKFNFFAAANFRVPTENCCGKSWNLKFRAWKVMESGLGHRKLWKIMWKVMENELLCMTKLQPDISVQQV